MGDISNFFDAKTIAVIGASHDEKKVGFAVFKNLLSSNKKIFPVNPNANEILRRKTYKDIFEIPYELDLIVIAVPAKLVPQILQQAQRKKVKSAIILSAGFSEIGNSKLEDEIKYLANKANITILGPNSYGIIDTNQKLNTTYFSQEFKNSQKGNITFISQSGAIGSAILDTDIKLSNFVSIGNSTQLDFTNFIKYFSDDKNTKIITLYIESLKPNKGRQFIDACKKCKKPIIALKSGKSKEGQKAAKSHTAALASESGVYSGILKQAGIIEVDSIKQLFDVAKILERYDKLGNKAAIITNAGGLGVLTTDACEENKIIIPQLKDSTINQLNKILPPNWSHNNPIDLIGNASAQDYEKTIQILEKENFDFFIILLTPQKMTEPLKTAQTLLKTKKPIFACFLGDKQITDAKEFIDKYEIINFDDPKQMCDTIGKLT